MFKNIQKEWIHPSPSHKHKIVATFLDWQIQMFRFLTFNVWPKTPLLSKYPLKQNIKNKGHQDNWCQASHSDESPVPKKSSRVVPEWVP